MVQSGRPDYVQPYMACLGSQTAVKLTAPLSLRSHPAPARAPLVHHASWQIKRAGKVCNRRVRADSWIGLSNAGQLCLPIVQPLRDVEEPIGTGCHTVSSIY
jgi:hypothetical protein